MSPSLPAVSVSERLAERIAALQGMREGNATSKVGQGESRSVPSPLVGEGQGGGDSQTENVGSPPTPNPSPQGGGGSGRACDEVGGQLSPAARWTCESRR